MTPILRYIHRRVASEKLEISSSRAIEEQQTCTTVAAHDSGLGVTDAARKRQLERDG
jgi:hypothetical protein